MRTTRSGESALLLLDVIDLLASQKIEYAVIGALAASVHGAVRASMDADVVLSVPLPEAEGLGSTLTAAGFQTELTRGDLEDPIPAMLKVTDRFGNRVDLLIGLKGLDPQAFSRAITAGGASLDLDLVRRLSKRFGREASESLDRLLKG